jgi:hypothetical protein
VSGPDTQQGRPPPPPQPPSGSPFGRFLTSPVLLVSVVALGVGVVTFASLGGGGGGGGSSSGGEPGDSRPAIEGSWESLPTSTGKQPVVQLDVAPSGGTLVAGRCGGELTPVDTDSDRWVFSYADRSLERGCPRRMRVTVSLESSDTLRIDARRFSGTLRRVG